MLKEIKNYKQVIKNSAWLFLIQAANYIFPLITVPYMMRILGPEGYGMIAVAQSLMQYVNVVSDYGFNMTATREISISRNNKNVIRELFNDVLICKLCIMTFCLIALFIVGMFIPLSESEKNFYLVANLLVIGNVLFPVWFFQGMEQMKYITYINLVSRTVSVVLIFVLVKESYDYILAIAIQGIGGLISGILSLVIIYSKFGLRIYRWPGKRRLVHLLKDGKGVFIATASGNIYGQGATLITGMIAGNAAAGYYSLGQKISIMFAAIVQPVAQAVYPHLCQVFSESQEIFFRLRWKILWGGFWVGSIIAVSLFFSARYIAYLITGKVELEFINIVKIFAVVTLGTILNVLLLPILLAMKRYSSIQNIYIKISVYFILCSIPLVYFCGSYGMPFAMVFVEYFILMKYIKYSSGKLDNVIDYM